MGMTTWSATAAMPGEEVGGQGDAEAGPPAEQPVGGGDDGVEVRRGDWPEQQDEHTQPEEGGGRVFEQLQPDVARREPLGGDT